MQVANKQFNCIKMLKNYFSLSQNCCYIACIISHVMPASQIHRWYRCFWPSSNLVYNH